MGSKTRSGNTNTVCLLEVAWDQTPVTHKQISQAIDYGSIQTLYQATGKETYLYGFV